MKRTCLKWCAAVLVVAGVSATAKATSTFFDGRWVNVEYWAGSGGQQAMTIVDFGGTNGNFAFGYRWDGNSTGWDMMQAIDAAGGLGMTYTYWAAFNAHTIDSVSYNGHSAVSDWFTSFLGYWGSTDGITWTAQGMGMDGRALADLDWDGWSVEDPTVSYDPLNPPSAPVPEPATMSLLALGAAAALRRRPRPAC